MHARAEKPVEALQQGHVAFAHLHARQLVAISRNQAWPRGQWPLRTGKRRKGPNGGR